VKVVVTEHGRDYVHTVAEAPSLEAVDDVLESLRAYFGDGNGRVRVMEEGATAPD